MGNKTSKVKNHPGIYVYETNQGRRYAVSTSVDGRQRWSQGHRTIVDAEQAREKLRNRGRAPASMTVGQYLLDHWLPTVDLRPSSVNTYRVITDRLVRYLGPQKLAKLGAMDIEALKTQMRRDEFAPKTRHATFTLLKLALKQARRWRLINFNPCEDVDAPERGEYEPVFHDWPTRDLASLARRLVAAADNEGYGLLIDLTISTGLRASEVFGMEWAHVDFAENLLRIPRSSTKSDAGARVVVLGSDMTERLREHRMEQMKWVRVNTGDDEATSSFVFLAHLNGRPLSQPRFYRTWDKVRRAADVPELHFHDMRHLRGTLLQRAKVNPRVAQEMLGHANISTTLSIYTHIDIEEQRAAVEALENLLRKE